MRWFSGHKRAGVALAITTTGVGAGAIIFAPLINYFIKISGWRDAFLYVGIIMAAIVVVAALLIRPAPKAERVPQPNVTSDAADSTPWRRRLPRMSMVAPFLTVTFIITVAIISFQAINVHFTPHAIDEGVSDAAAAAALGLIGGFSIPGRLISGLISDAVGWQRTLAVALFGMALSIPWLLFLDANWMLYAFAFSYGVCHGIRVPAQLGILQQTFGLESLGQLVGISTAIGQVCGAVAPYVAGFIYDQTGSYSLVFYILMAMLVATGILAFMVKGQPKSAPEPADG
jgi:MFS family permease